MDILAVLGPVLQPAVVLAGVGVLFRVLVTDRIRGLEEQRDDYKAQWKDAVRSRRVLRGEIEARERGGSAPPPPSEEEHTGVYRDLAAVDRKWTADRGRLSRREEERLGRYVADDPLSTPPESVVPPRRRR